MRHLLIVLILLMGVMPEADAASRARRVVFHDMGYELNARETELLDCKYGEANVGLGPGKCFNGGGRMPLPDFLYVKWRDRATKEVYEERVDLKRRLPSPRKMDGATVYWLIDDNQLYIYLIPDGGDSSRPSTIRNRRLPDQPPNGPTQYDHLDVKTLYPDNAPPKVHGLTPIMEVTRAARRTEHAAQKAAEETTRREAAERGECLLIDEVMGICKPDPAKQRRQQP